MPRQRTVTVVAEHEGRRTVVRVPKDRAPDAPIRYRPPSRRRGPRRRAVKD